jgi:hypothetical protein
MCGGNRVDVPAVALLAFKSVRIYTVFQAIIDKYRANTRLAEYRSMA